MINGSHIPEKIAKGDQNGLSKLREIDIPAIRIKAAKGITFTDIAKEFGVSRSAIGYVAHAKTWKHV